MYRGALSWDFALLCNMRKIESSALWMVWMKQLHEWIFKTMRKENIEIFLPDFSTSLFDYLSSLVHQSASEGEKKQFLWLSIVVTLTSLLISALADAVGVFFSFEFLSSLTNATSSDNFPLFNSCLLAEEFLAFPTTSRSFFVSCFNFRYSLSCEALEINE